MVRAQPLFAGFAIGVLGRHWLVSFAVAKYGPDRQVVKETNLFFALPALLAAAGQHRRAGRMGQRPR